MSADDRESKERGQLEKLEREVDIEVDPPFPGSLTVYGENVSIKVSSIMALKELAQIDPAIANSLVSASREAASFDTKKYLFGAVAAAVVALSMLIGSVLIIIEKGLLPGLAFFIVCAAVASVYSAVFTGTSQSLEWTLKFLKWTQKSGDQPDR